eukprot:jgi/Antlo1/256/2368
MRVLVGQENNISHAEEDKIIYENIKSNLESSWDALGNVYLNEAEILHREIMKDLEVWKLLEAARAEIETGCQSYSLMEKEIIRKVNVKGIEKENPPVLKLRFLEDLMRIFEETAEVLEKAILEEEAVSKEDNSPSFFRENSICCQIKYGIIDLEGSLPLVAILSQEEKNTYTFGDIKIFIYEGIASKSNSLCEYVLHCLDHGYSLEELFKSIQYCIALYIGKIILHTPEILEGFLVENEKAIYFIKNNDVLEIKIKEEGAFVIIFNGEHRILESFT